MKINHISISRESCFTECGQKYKFRYHLCVPSPEPTPIYFTFGSIVHEIIEEYTVNRGSISLEVIARKALEKNYLSPEYKNKLVRHLNNFMKVTKAVGLEGEVEWKFEIDMDGQGRKMLGYIDRLIQKGDRFFCLDYKTTKPGKWRKNKDTIGSDLQLQCYAYVISQHFKVPAENIEAGLIFLDDYKVIKTKFNEASLKSVPERLLSVYKQIENADPQRVSGNVGKHCTRCEFKSICSFYKGSQYETKWPGNNY